MNENKGIFDRDNGAYIAQVEKSKEKRGQRMGKKKKPGKMDSKEQVEIKLCGQEARMAIETDLSVNENKKAKGVQACDYFVFYSVPPPGAGGWGMGKEYKDLCIYMDWWRGRWKRRTKYLPSLHFY